MANKSMPAAPGTTVRGGVRSTMMDVKSKGAGGGQGVGGGTYDRNKAPFDKPHDTGGGGIPTKFYDGMSPSGVPAPGKSDRTSDYGD